MMDEKRLKELEDLNRQLLEANTLLQRNLARLELLMAGARYHISLFVTVLIVVLILVSVYPLALSYAQTVYNPTKVPSDYDKVNRFVLENGVEGTKVFWLPAYRQGFKYAWAPEKRIGPFNSLSSNPSLGNIYDTFRTDSYINWLEKFWRPFFPDVTLKSEGITLKPNLASRLLVPFSARYVIVDSSVPEYEFDALLAWDTSLRLAFQSGSLNVYEISGSPDNVWPAVQTLKVGSYWDNLAVMLKLYENPLNGIAFVNGDDSVGKEYGQLDINDYESWNLVANAGFEEGYGWIPFFSWTQASSDTPFTILPDRKIRNSGKTSLKIVNEATEAYDIGWVTSDEMPAIGDSVYRFESNVKYSNVNWTNVSVEGYSQDKLKWELLAQSPGIRARTADWKKYEISFYIPPGITRLRILAGGGWSFEPSEGPGVSWFDDIKLTRVDDSFFSKIENGRKPGSVRVTYRKLSPTKYKVRVRNSGGPFVLAFGEARDPNWTAHLPNGDKVSAVPLYETICGFPISQSGTFDLMIEYSPERWFHIGFVVSMATLLLGLLLILWTRNKGSVPFAETFSTAVHLVKPLFGSGASAPETDEPGAGVIEPRLFPEDDVTGATAAADALEGFAERRTRRISSGAKWVLANIRKLGARIREAVESPPRRRL